MRSLFIKALLRITAFFLWTCFSAWLFVQVEYTEKDHINEKYQLLRSLYESMASKYNMTIHDFNNFSNVAHEALTVPKLQWTYRTSFDFVFQLVTTIGYGYITPKTPEGQILCIFVALVGIPITMLALKTVGELIVHGVNTVVKKFERKILKRPEPKLVQTKTAVMLFLLMTTLIIILALLLARRARLTVIEAVYFWFVTYTTIGFGDYIARHLPQNIQQLSNNSSRIQEETGDFNNDATIQIVIIIFFLISTILGLCLVASVLNSIIAAVEELQCRPACPGCLPRKIRDHVDNEIDSSLEQRDTAMTYSSKKSGGFQERNKSSLSVIEIE